MTFNYTNKFEKASSGQNDNDSYWNTEVHEQKRKAENMQSCPIFVIIGV